MEPIILNKNNHTQEPDLSLGDDYHRCLHCQCCGGGCPFIEAFDYAPNGIIRLVQLGETDQALSSNTIWVCVACNTCAKECPMAIDIPALMDNLRQAALRRNMVPAEPDVLKFHQTVLDSIAHYGRTHKLEIMMRFKLTTRRWLQDWQVGLKMLAKRKLDLLPSRVRKIDDIKAFFKGESKERKNG